MTTAAPPDDTVGLSRDAAGRAVPSARQRATGRLRLEDPLLGWAVAIGIGLLAFFLRVWKLGTPRQFAFDETYYAKDAWSLLKHGYVRSYVGDANEKILDGTTSGIWKDEPSLIVHPEVGKWLIAAGEHFFGMDPFGWRIASAVVGALMVVVMCRLARRLTGSTVLGCVAGLLLCFDGLHFVLSRLALLDIFMAFFLLCAVAAPGQRPRLAPPPAGPALPGDRWPTPAGTARCGASSSGRGWWSRACASGSRSARSGPLCSRWPRSACWPGPGLGRPPVLRRALAGLKSVLTDALPAFVQIVGVAFVVYLATWTGWLVHAPDYERDLSSTQYTQFTGSGHCDDETFVSDNPDQDARWPTATEPDASGPAELWQSLRSLWSYHQDVYVFHADFLDCSDAHRPVRPSGWLLQNRPVGVEADVDIKPGTQGCDAPRAATASGRSSCSARPSCGGAAHRAAVRGGDVGRRSRLAVRAHGRGSCVDLAALAACTTTGRSSCSTRWRSCRSSCWR